MAEAVENHHKSKTENDRIISEIQLKLLRTDNLEDLFGILSASVHELIGTGVVASVQLNEADSSMQFVNCIGLGDTLDKIISALGFDPTKKLTPIDKMKEREFRIYCSGKLEKIDAGLYGLLESLVPENVCSNVQKMMNVKDVFTIGLIQKDLPMGGLVILTRNDISEHFDAIERIVGQAAFVIQRKRAEEALKKSEEKYRLLINTANESVIVTQNGFFRFANPMTLTLLDVESEKELIDEPFAKFLYPEDSGILSDFRSRISQKSQTHKFSIRIMTKKKESKWVEINSVLFEWQSRKATLSFITDVTEKKQIVDALRESELKYRTLIDCANEIIAVIQDGTACHVNSMAVSLTGYSEAELTSNPFETFIYPEDRHMIMERHQKRLKCESVPDRYEFRLVMKDGSIRWVQNGAVQIEWNGRPATLNFLVDINDRKKAEKEVLKIVQHYQALIEKAPDGVVLINAAGLFKFISPSAKKIFGYGVFEEIIGNPAEFTHPDDLPVVLSELAKIFENPSYVPILQYRFAHKSGNWIWIESTFSNLLADPSVESVVINFRDITDRKKIEEIIQRTAKLDSLGVLAGGIAHDFNNILAGIFGYIDLANSRSKDLKVSEYLSKALNSMERARGLTEQLLTFSKGGDPVKKTALLFPYLQETALFALSGSAVSCNFDYPENLWTCNFDCNQIGQVIENVVINAQQSMPLGGIIEFTARNLTISEKEHPVLEHGKYVKMSIKDSGIGIPKELLSRIFDPFFTTKPKGHGLGLATCYSIINRHGGCIDVESEQGKGSTFHIYIPASSEPALMPFGSESLQHTGSGTILVMDDEEIIGDIVSNMLQSFGYKVVYKMNGKEIINFLKTEKEASRDIAAMIFDLTIPGGMGGKETIKEVRKMNIQIPAFVASGYAEDPVMANPLKYGFTASICKPFKIIDLMRMLNTHLKQ